MAERLDLLALLRRELARSLAAGHLLALDVVLDLLDDAGSAKRRRVAESAKFGDVAMTRRMILPDRVFGMSATIQTMFGRAIVPIFLASMRR